jgi:alkanesulfonate monooxygenase SsuD/methylene tetrahydromethanopterin reductase-like flavin-dependent oxidoreductase (luciferase family)
MKALWKTGQAEYHGKFIDFPAVKVYPQPKQKPHPPVLLGGHGEVALKRVVAWCEGWFPFQLSPKVLREEMQKLWRLAEETDRNPDSLEVSLSWLGDTSDLDTLKRYQDTGIHRLVCLLPAADPANYDRGLERLAEQTIGKVG